MPKFNFKHILNYFYIFKYILIMFYNIPNLYYKNIFYNILCYKIKLFFTEKYKINV